MTKLVCGEWGLDAMHSPNPVRIVLYRLHVKLTSGQETWESLDFGLCISYVFWWLREGSIFFVLFRFKNRFFGSVEARRRRFSDEYNLAWSNCNRMIQRIRHQHYEMEDDECLKMVVLQIDMFWDNAFERRLLNVNTRRFWVNLQQTENEIGPSTARRRLDAIDVSPDAIVTDEQDLGYVADDSNDFESPYIES